jgi:hypothetical protein
MIKARRAASDHPIIPYSLHMRAVLRIDAAWTAA